MTNILDELDVIKNIQQMYDGNNSFEVLKDFERVLDDLDLYVYKNWADGEVAAGPKIDRYFVTVTLFWPYAKMPDPSGAMRLKDYNCHISFNKSYFIKPKKIETPNDFRPGTKKGKLIKEPIWLVTIKMPKSLMSDMFNSEVDNDEIQDSENTQPAPNTETPSVSAPEFGADTTEENT